MEKYYIIESHEFGLKEVEVTDSIRDAREKSGTLTNGSYRRVNEKEARKIAAIIQWGLLPKDITKSLMPQ